VPELKKIRKRCLLQIGKRARSQEFPDKSVCSFSISRAI
jgi:hypothetical protein